MDFMVVGQKVLKNDPKLSVMDKLRIGAKMSAVNMAMAATAPVSWPWGNYRGARIFGCSRLFSAAIAGLSLAASPVAVFAPMTIPATMVLPFLPLADQSIQVSRELYANSRDPMAKLYAWSYR